MNEKRLVRMIMAADGRFISYARTLSRLRTIRKTPEFRERVRELKADVESIMKGSYTHLAVVAAFIELADPPGEVASAKLTAAGLCFSSLEGGLRLVVSVPGRGLADYWTGSAVWRLRDGHKGLGVESLIVYVGEGVEAWARAVAALNEDTNDLDRVGRLDGWFGEGLWQQQSGGAGCSCERHLPGGDPGYCKHCTDRM